MFSIGLFGVYFCDSRAEFCFLLRKGLFFGAGEWFFGKKKVALVL